MSNNFTLENFISEYQFNEFITDEELLKITEVFTKMKSGIPRRILRNILAYSRAVEFHKMDRVESRMILN